MKKRFFRICSMILVIVLLVNMLPTSILAEEFRESLTAETEAVLEAAKTSDAQIVGEIIFYAPDGKNVVMVMPAPFLLDANDAYNEDVQVQLTGKGSVYTLTYLLPRQWLAAEERAWPVILDPVIKSSRDKLGMQDRTVSENVTFSATKTTIDAGYSAERGKIRGFFKYTQLPPLTSSDVILDATFKLTKVENNSVSKTVEVHKVKTFSGRTIRSRGRINLIL